MILNNNNLITKHLKTCFVYMNNCGLIILTIVNCCVFFKFISEVICMGIPLSELHAST